MSAPVWHGAWLVAVLGVLWGCSGIGGPSRTFANGSPVPMVDAACVTRIRPLYDKLRDIDSRLNVGLVQAAYSEKLGDVRVVYDEIVRGGPLIGACFDAGSKLQDALNEYNAANTRWTECIRDTNCTVDDDALPAMQGRWTMATKLLDEVALTFP